MMERMRRSGRRLHRLRPGDDVDRELAYHMEMREQELVSQGWERVTARAEVQRLFGDYAAIRSECAAIAQRSERTHRRSIRMSELMQDLRYAARWLLKERAFTAVAVLTLALGVGANTAAFTIVNGVLLAPLPYEEPDRLVAIWEETESGSEMSVAWPNYADWRAESRTLRDMAAHQGVYATTVLGGSEPTRATVAGVTASLFSTLGGRAVRGRVFTEGLEVGSPAEVVVSEGFWRTQLGSAPDLTRVQLQALGTTAQVVGVMPASFDFPRGTQVWFPLDIMDPAGLGTRSAHNFSVVGRLADGVSVAAAEQELTTLTARIRERDPEADAAGVEVADLREDSVGDTRRALLILLGASGFVLLVACTNLAGSLLGRSAQRQQELAVRSSLGAARRRLVRQLLTESLLLGAVGAAVGLGVATLLVRVAVALGPQAVPRLADVQLDARVLGFTMLLAVVTALLFGTVPALRATATQPFDAMRGRGTADPRQRRGWLLLVGTEVALAVLLLIGSGLLIRSFHRLTQTDPGFDIRQQLAVAVSLPESNYPTARRVQFHDALLERVRSLPGVEHASLTMTVPLVSFDPNGTFYLEGDDEGDGSAHYRVVGTDFFATMRTPILRGRSFTAADRAGAPDVVIINEQMAEQYFAGENPLGRRIRTGGMDSRGREETTIVGIAGDVRYRGLDAPAAAAYYLPYSQRPDRILNATLLVRTTGRPLALADDVREVVRSLDTDVAVEVATLASRIGESFAGRRFMLFVLGTFAAIALLLAAVGIYGVVAFAVARRTREIGIRIALGESARSVLWTVSRGTMAGVLMGLTAGIAGALALSRVIVSLLYEVEPIDPLTFASVAVLLLATAWAAVLLPARRATRISPMNALRAD